MKRKGRVEHESFTGEQDGASTMKQKADRTELKWCNTLKGGEQET